MLHSKCQQIQGDKFIEPVANNSDYRHNVITAATMILHPQLSKDAVKDVFTTIMNELDAPLLPSDHTRESDYDGIMWNTKITIAQIGNAYIDATRPGGNPAIMTKECYDKIKKAGNILNDLHERWLNKIENFTTGLPPINPTMTASKSSKPSKPKKTVRFFDAEDKSKAPIANPPPMAPITSSPPNPLCADGAKLQFPAGADGTKPEHWASVKQYFTDIISYFSSMQKADASKIVGYLEADGDADSKHTNPGLKTTDANRKERTKEVTALLGKIFETYVSIGLKSNCPNDQLQIISANHQRLYKLLSSWLNHFGQASTNILTSTRDDDDIIELKVSLKDPLNLNWSYEKKNLYLAEQQALLPSPPVTKEDIATNTLIQDLLKNIERDMLVKSNSTYDELSKVFNKFSSKADGNCLYHSLEHYYAIFPDITLPKGLDRGTDGSAPDYRNIRTFLVNSFYQRIKEFPNYIQGLIAENADFDTVIKSYQDNGWISSPLGLFMVGIAAQVLELPIIVVKLTPTNDPFTVNTSLMPYNPNIVDKPTVFLEYTGGNHYDLYMLSELLKDPAIQKNYTAASSKYLGANGSPIVSQNFPANQTLISHVSDADISAAKKEYETIKAASISLSSPPITSVITSAAIKNTLTTSITQNINLSTSAAASKTGKNMASAATALKALDIALANIARKLNCLFVRPVKNLFTFTRRAAKTGAPRPILKTGTTATRKKRVTIVNSSTATSLYPIVKFKSPMKYDTIVLNMPNGSPIELSEGDCIQFQDATTPKNKNGTRPPIIGKIGGFGHSGEKGPPDRIFYYQRIGATWKKMGERTHDYIALVDPVPFGVVLHINNSGKWKTIQKLKSCPV